MNATKQILFLLFLIPFLAFGQKTKYPKDTIYIKFDSSKHKKKNLDHPEFGKSIYFWKLGVYYDYKFPPDTLCTKHLKEYEFSDLKEIEEKERKYYKKRFGGNPWIKNKNAVFQTFLIEIISKEKFVVYPVIWRNEGVID